MASHTFRSRGVRRAKYHPVWISGRAHMDACIWITAYPLLCKWLIPAARLAQGAAELPEDASRPVQLQRPARKPEQHDEVSLPAGHVRREE